VPCDPPLNLTGFEEGACGVRLNWEIPGSGGIDTWIHYDDGVNNDAIGLTEGGTFCVAIRFTPGQLEPYAEAMLTEVTIYVNGFNSGYELRIWTSQNATNLIYSDVITESLVIQDWNTITLNPSIPIDVTQELWIGYAVVDQPSGEYPAGCDVGPAVAGYGDMISLDGVTWDPLSGYGLDYNWNIQGHVIGVNGELPELPPLEQTSFNNSITSKPVAGEIETTPDAFSPPYRERSLIGYNVYRNDVMVNDSVVLTTSYLDEDLPYGYYEYYVTAIYTFCES